MGFLQSLLNTKFTIHGESTKHIDWKLYAKTDRLYTKRYEDETNLSMSYDNWIIQPIHVFSKGQRGSDWI